MKTKRCKYCDNEIAFEALECSNCGGAIAVKPDVAVFDHFEEVKNALSEKYEIIAEIGHGGNATVYQAIQKNLERKVALKVLLPGLVNDPGYMERFHLEARAIAKLRHPNIVTVYDEGNEQGVHFIAMEFLEGKDLHQLVKEKGSLQIQEAVEMAKCIASALDYAHSYGIIHRDVKSSNIIMTSNRTAVLTDFGIAQSGVALAHTKSGSLLGTPDFMSPEQAGGKTVDARTDFYSLGVVLYHTLSGHYPFQGDSPITTLQRILYENPVPLGRLVKLPPALERAIEQCLVKDPEKRVRNGKELIELLNSPTVESSPPTVESSPPTVETPAPRPAVQQVQRPAPGKSEVTSRPPDPQSGEVSARRLPPRSPVPQVDRSGTRRRRPLVKTAVLAGVACLMLTGYVTWQKALKGSVKTTRAEAALAVLPERKLVPYLIGATKEEAINLLTREGFGVGGVRAVAVPNPGKRGKVDSQRPTYGTSAALGTTVDLLIGE
jgi:serine/threonine protein kinase